MPHPPPAVEPTGLTEIVITSFGVLHGPPPETIGATLLLDLRHALYNPFDDPNMRGLTGLDPVVVAHVLASPGAEDVISDTTARLLALREYTAPRGERADLLVMCKGGRHRSVTISEEIASHIRSLGIDAEVQHRDINKPVIDTTTKEN